MTERLYETDSHLKKFTADVVSCEPSGKGFRAVLDRTAFFPEGGGQAADGGVLGEVRVADVRDEGGVIFHYIDKALTVGQLVCGEIDWEKRFFRMQQHTGEHIVSGLIHSRFGYDNVGFHLGEEVCTLDLSGPLTKEELEEIEYAANVAAVSDLPVEISYPQREELVNMEYRSKIEIEGQVRIVTIPGVDVCACCAPHVNRTGEIGLIKFIQSQNYKGGVRITMVCGFRALRDYRLKEKNVKAVMQSLSVKEELVASAVEHLKDENTKLNGKLDVVRRKLLAYKAEDVQEGAETAVLFERELEGSGPRELMNLVLDRGTAVCAVFTGTDQSGYRYVIGSRDRDVRELCRKLNERFKGRGGGKPEMVQGSLTGKNGELAEFIGTFGKEGM